MRTAGAFPAWVLAAGLLSAACQVTMGVPARDGVPPEGLPSGWIQSSPPRTFSGEALYDHIDGGAEIFLELGFKTCTVSRCAGPGGGEIVLESYEMVDSAAALGIYLMNCGRETPDAALPSRNTVGRTQVRAVKGCFYLVATAGSTASDVRAPLLETVRAALARVPVLPEPGCLSWIPETGQAAGSLRIVRGSLGLQASLPFVDSDFLLLAPGGATAVSADYPVDGGSLIRLAAVYESPKAALSGADRFAAALGWEPAGADSFIRAGKTPDGRACRITLQGPRLDLEAGPPTGP